MALNAAAVVFFYIVGSVPFGLLIVKYFYHDDIRRYGSGNPGATNVWRGFGKIPGIITLLLDILKGVAAVLTARHLFNNQMTMNVACGMAAIIGHNWSIFLKGKGGKGVATSAGVFLALLPWPSTVALASFLVVFLISGHVSAGSMSGALGLMAGTFIWETPLILKLIVALAGLMVLIKHIPNIKRMSQGTEPKVKVFKS